MGVSGALFCMGGCGWCIILGEWRWLGNYFWVSGGGWGIIFGKCGWVGGEWGWLHCLIMPI